jgi:ABC-2 type transport system ATP-binding protein
MDHHLVTIFASRLVKRFPRAKGNAVDQVSLSVERGETFGLIGPDGAGKSTTIRVILGLLKRTSGESAILGFDSMRQSFDIRERVGYIAQQFALPADLTVLENLRFFADIHNVSRQAQNRRIPALLDFAGLQEYQSRPSGRLSGGMKKKLALACSLVHEPAVLMLDEPTLGVDPISRREFWNMLGNLRAEKGLTILVATPYMDEAERCSRVGLIFGGRLVACDTPSAIKQAVPGRVVEFTPSHLDEAARLAQMMPGVLEVQTYGAMIHAFVDDPSLRIPQIISSLMARGIHCSQPRELAMRMEEAFISLIRRQEAVRNDR